MARARAILNPFGASLLDMMTCALGATILLFVLRHAGNARALAAAETEFRYLEIAVEETAARLQAAEKKQEQVAKRLREAAETSVFGLPPIEGPLSIAVDVSGSMDWFRISRLENFEGSQSRVRSESLKMQRAFDLVRQVLAANPNISECRITTFAGSVIEVSPWQSLPDGESRLLMIEDLMAELRAKMETPPLTGTNLVGAVTDALSTGLENGQRRTVLVISDGKHELLDDDPTIEETIERIGADADRDRSGFSRAQIHTVGLFDNPCCDPPPPARVIKTMVRYDRGLQLVLNMNQLSGETELAGLAAALGLTESELCEKLGEAGASELGKLLSAMAALSGGTFLGLAVDVKSVGEDW